MKANKVISGLVLLTGIVSILAGCSLLPVEEEALKPPLVKPVKENFELYEVKKSTIVKKASLVGTFKSRQTTNYFFKESGHRIAAMRVKLGDAIQPGDVLVELEKGDLETRIALQRLNLEKAQIASSQIQQTEPDRAYDIRLKKIDVEAAQLQLNALQDQLEKTKLIASSAGIVTYITDAQQGSVVDAFSTLVILSDPSKLQLAYESSDSGSLTGIEVGMNVDVKIGSEEKMIQGKVLQTPSSAPLTDNKAAAERNAKTLIVSVPEGTEGVKFGNSGDMTIVLEKRENVIVIPRTGLRSYLGRDYVQVLDGESRKEIDVEKGLVTPTEIEIRTGLKEGQNVILNN
ncbi:efflux RND transporter periplasmic adaptor subunit [Paenibacillus sp. HWE-109]|uniref:efflux RND transporter periplasmic adaptor subunit n=1 Tax=Paenibacillus sp. HWE-109 TaxID=1306526 RepID=UPI001EDDC1F4|nr:efflux RND transporter periplasmic adaptor subunit [Paenibacillus sp. HWE-109]UKS24413.1 efflux RND transporter periplasmic adaptor subunit [Paenibacillus sp. HWE-109]